MDNLHRAMITCIQQKQAEERCLEVAKDTELNRTYIVQEGLRLLTEKYCVSNKDIEKELDKSWKKRLDTGKHGPEEFIPQAMKEALDTIVHSYKAAKDWVTAYKNSSERSACFLERLAESTALAKSWRLVMTGLTGVDYSNVEPRIR